MFELVWRSPAAEAYERLKQSAETAQQTRGKSGKKKSSRQEALFKQVNKALRYLRDNPKHPGLATHKYDSLEHPYDQSHPVFAAYAQNDTPGAYRIFWCYGPGKGELTVLAITAHP